MILRLDALNIDSILKKISVLITDNIDTLNIESYV